MTEPTDIARGTNHAGEQNVIITATFPNFHQVTWEREVIPGRLPKAPRKRTADTAREHAAAVAEWAADLKAAADWADAHRDDLRGASGTLR